MGSEGAVRSEACKSQTTMAVDMALVRTVYYQQRCELRKQASLVASSAAQLAKTKKK
jgi:hypothetical protein